jgi:hypothetical protein
VSNQEFLLYPIDIGEDLVCPSYGCKSFGTLPETSCADAAPGETSG